MRFIGLDIHRDFCEVAISEGGPASSAGRVKSDPEQLELFARSLAPSDRVVLESTGNALAIARILQPHVEEVVLANPMHVRAISHAKVKNDRFDARALAELLAADLVPRVVLVEAAWATIKTPGPLRAFYQRVRARRGAQIAIVAVARKIAILCWQLLTKHQDYAYQRPTHVARKLRTLELQAGAADQKGKLRSPRPGTAAERAVQERALTEQAEHAYGQLVADWRASAPSKKGAGAAPGRAPNAARQGAAPNPVL